MILGLSQVFFVKVLTFSTTINVAVVISNLLLNIITDVEMPHFNIFLTTAYAINTVFFSHYTDHPVFFNYELIDINSTCY